MRPRVVDDTTTDVTASSTRGGGCGVERATPHAGRRTLVSLRIHTDASLGLLAAGIGHMTGNTLRGHSARQLTAFGRPSQCRWTPLFGQNIRALEALVFHSSFIATRSSRCDRFRQRQRCLLNGHSSNARAGE
jgi:hypothetical protein